MLVVFDAYGTLWDIERISQAVKDEIGAGDAGRFLALWRQKQLEYAFLETLMDRFEPFSLVRFC
ncbi:hypothetical protein [Sulfobacillus harzensis]|uniref:Haloacid dehalogenase n=1 Tax=Sulfobacillus harzensis TaxID=2729629 RepID=A0A7Y0L0T2_9FIRM|nr:hypothetical protein [Sulfobacillus harzensis]NMP21188.1 hypothetical protein [Sulfobacillus harzensis]